jgi:hypothetical protein
MSELILAVHNGPHDAVVAVLVDYDLKAAVQLERLTCVKGDGDFPDLSIEEALGMSVRRGATSTYLQSAVPLIRCSTSVISAVGGGCANSGGPMSKARSCDGFRERRCVRTAPT